MQGKITRFFDERRFGFIRDGDGHDHFFHIDDIADETIPTPGLRVTFRIGMHKSRTKAVGVRTLTPAVVLGGAITTKKENISDRQSHS